MHPGRMRTIKGYTIEMIEFVGVTHAAFAPSFGVFSSLLAARKAAALRIALSAPRVRPIGYRILDHNNRQVCLWPIAVPAG
jgi:hypothetical protein